MLTFQMFDLEKVGHGHGVQLSQWCNLLANINIHKNHLMHFTVSEI